MSVYVESGIELDLSRALSHEKHDHDDVNKVFPGVDFVIGTDDRAIWLEIKSWSRNVIPSRRRGGQRRSYLAKMQNKKFPTELRGKFLGTCSFLTLTGTPPSGRIVYAMLLESDSGDSALRSHLMTRMRGQLPTHGPVKRRWAAGTEVHVAVLDVADWNELYPEFPASLTTQ